MFVKDHASRAVKKSPWRGLLVPMAAVSLVIPANMSGPAIGPTELDSQVIYRTTSVDGLDVFYREAGSTSNPTVLLLHGFPTSSHMFRNLIPMLADEYHVIAPDYPGFGFSAMPSVDEFEYTFDRIAEVIEQLIDQLQLDTYSMYIMDYGAPVGYRVATRHPERLEALIVQNGNAYEEGLREFWDPIKAYWAQPNEANGETLRGFFSLAVTKWQFLHGVRDSAMVSPDNWAHVQPLLDRPGNDEIQLQLFYDYSSNPPLYPSWQEFLRDKQPPTLIVWGANDYIFPAEGAHPYKQDLHDIEFHLLDTGHFALEEKGYEIATLIRSFLGRKLKART